MNSIRRNQSAILICVKVKPFHALICVSFKPYPLSDSKLTHYTMHVYNVITYLSIVSNVIKYLFSLEHIESFIFK